MHVGLSCLSPSAAWRSGPSPTADVFALLHVPAAIPLRTGGRTLYFVGQQLYRFWKDEERQQWRCSTRAYSYTLAEDENLSSECMAWHWHPSTSGDPHVHVRTEHPALGSVGRMHLPTARVSFEAVVRFLISELGVECHGGDDWMQRLAETEAAFVEHRQWHHGNQPDN